MCYPDYHQCPSDIFNRSSALGNIHSEPSGADQNLLTSWASVVKALNLESTDTPPPLPLTRGGGWYKNQNQIRIELLKHGHPHQAPPPSTSSTLSSLVSHMAVWGVDRQEEEEVMKSDPSFFSVSLFPSLSGLPSFRNWISGSRGASDFFDFIYLFIYLFVYLFVFLFIYLFSHRYCGINIVDVTGRGEWEREEKTTFNSNQ